jgi:D-3-phosphoglycerate dehydrogenase
MLLLSLILAAAVSCFVFVDGASLVGKTAAVRRVLISDPMSSHARDIFLAHGIEVEDTAKLSPSELQDVIHKYDGLLIRSMTRVTADMLKSGAAGRLQVVGRAGAGVDNIDLISAKQHGVIVMNTPGANTNATAEHTLALLLALYRQIPDASHSTHAGLWEKNL